MTEHKPFGPYERFVKRPLDFLIALLGLLLLSPLFLLLALLVRLKLGAPVLFTQERPGRGEKIFRLCKFRTMTDARDEKGELLPDGERLTGFGSFLRATSLDELPELLNILRGDMALIGPRPLLVRYLPWYTEQERLRHAVRPGLTGLAQVSGRNFLGWDRRLALDAAYVKRITFWGDLKIVGKTVWKVFRREDVSVDTDQTERYLDEERQQEGQAQ
ncbi:MAG: sugar transferase [Clostridiales bacterium]|nr:sugar transferase [Clostridiales bacterium]